MKPAFLLKMKRAAASLFAVLAVAPSAPAAPTAVTATAFSPWTANNATENSLPFVFAPGPDGILVAWVTGEGTFGAAQAASFVWDDGITQTPLTLGDSRAAGGTSGTGGAFVQLYFLLNPPTGSGTVRVTLNGPGSSIQRSVLGALYASNVRGWEASATAASSGVQALTAGSLAVSEGALVVDIAGHSQSPFEEASGIVGGGDTILYLHPGGATGSGSGAGYISNTPAGDYSAQWSIAGGPQHEAVLIASFAASSGADIRSFAVDDPFVAGTPVIDQTARTITIPILPGADLANFAPTLFLSDGATSDPASGSVQDFSDPAGVTYAVTSEDNSVTREYTVTTAFPPGLGAWNEPAGGTWETTTNWLNDTLPVSQAYFPGLNPPGGAIAVTSPGSIGGGFPGKSTIGTFIFNSPERYTLTPGPFYPGGDTTFRALQGEHVLNINFGNDGQPLVQSYVILDVAQNAKLTSRSNIYQYWLENPDRINPANEMGVRKIGPGTAVVTHDYETQPLARQPTRPTQVNEGVLLVNNTAGTGLSTYAEIQVNATGTLGGTGSVGYVHPHNANGGRVTVNSGGAIAPGDGVGTFTLKNGLTLMDGSNLTFELGAAPATSDLLRITGGTFTGSGDRGVTVTIEDAGGLALGSAYTLIDFDGAIPTGVDLSDFQLAPGPFAGGLLSMDDTKLQVTIGVFELRVASDGSDLVLRWDSKNGKLYNVRSETDPSVALPAEWPIFGGHAGIAATPPENILRIPYPADPFRLFVIEEFNAPPLVVLSDDFENGQGAWTSGSDGAVGTRWELGVPTGSGPSAAHSAVNCFGTNIAGNYDADADIWLRTPPIDLTAAGRAILSYFEFRDIEENFDSGQVVVLDASNNAALATIDSDIDGTTANWTQVTKNMPGAALGKVVKIEFRFTSDAIQNLAGWYIDDVQVTIP